MALACMISSSHDIMMIIMSWLNKLMIHVRDLEAKCNHLAIPLVTHPAIALFYYCIPYILVHIQVLSVVFATLSFHHPSIFVDMFMFFSCLGACVCVRGGGGITF